MHDSCTLLRVTTQEQLLTVVAPRLLRSVKQASWSRNSRSLNGKNASFLPVNDWSSEGCRRGLCPLATVFISIYMECICMQCLLFWKMIIIIINELRESHFVRLVLYKANPNFVSKKFRSRPHIWEWIRMYCSMHFGSLYTCKQCCRPQNLRCFLKLWLMCIHVDRKNGIFAIANEVSSICAAFDCCERHKRPNV